MDRVRIEELRVNTIIGVNPWERRVRQPVVLDLELSADIAKAAARDDLADTLDYNAVARRVTAWVEAANHRLVETLAENLAQLVRDEFGVSWVKVSVRKLGVVPGARAVGVVIER